MGYIGHLKFYNSPLPQSKVFRSVIYNRNYQEFHKFHKIKYLYYFNEINDTSTHDKRMQLLTPERLSYLKEMVEFGRPGTAFGTSHEF
jgi:hypothetical protein